MIVTDYIEISIEERGYLISIQATLFEKLFNSNWIFWQILTPSSVPAGLILPGRGTDHRISTMRFISANLHQSTRFMRASWPEVKHLSQIKSEMELIQSNLSAEQEPQLKYPSGEEQSSYLRYLELRYIRYIISANQEALHK